MYLLAYYYLFIYHLQEIQKNLELEDKELSISMMNKKTKRLYQRMQYGIHEKQGQVANLIEKRKRIEEDGSAAAVVEENSGAKNNKGSKKLKK